MYNLSYYVVNSKYDKSRQHYNNECIYELELTYLLNIRENIFNYKYNLIEILNTYRNVA